MYLFFLCHFFILELKQWYVYDAWGNHKIYNSAGLDITNDISYNNHIGRINPFRYKGYYYDEETGLYYLQSRYYDPTTRRFINADNVAIVATDYLTTLGGQNLYSYCLNDPVNSYDPDGHVAISAIIGVVLAVLALAGAVVGLVSAIGAFVKEPSWINLLFVVLAVVDVVMSVFGVVSAIKNLISSIAKTGAKAFVSTADDTARAGKKICNGEKGCVAGNCFKEGTKVLTKDGYKNIEDIQVGDEVLSYDEQTGLQAYKKVVHLFRGETKEWHHIFVNGEEIVCTGEHPFFIDGKGFVEAKYLTKEDSLVLSNGSIVKIDKIEREKLLKPQTKYNFEVEDFHTYYVTKKDVLVHNDCKPTPHELGKMGEDYIAQTRKLIKNNGRFKYDGRIRIPDFIDEGRRALIESKNVAKQGLTKQLKDYKQIAQARGLKMQLYVRQDTKLSKSLLKSGIEILRFPW